MSPIFGYVMILAMYVMAALAGLAICLVLAALPSMRRASAQIAGGIIGSFPGVFLFQALAAPFLFITFVVLWSVQHVIGPFDGAAQIAWGALVVISTFGFFLSVSIIGFTIGWRIGARAASGMPIRSALRASNLLVYLMSGTPLIGKRFNAFIST